MFREPRGADKTFHGSLNATQDITILCSTGSKCPCRCRESKVPLKTIRWNNNFNIKQYEAPVGFDSFEQSWLGAEFQREFPVTYGFVSSCIIIWCMFSNYFSISWRGIWWCDFILLINEKLLTDFSYKMLSLSRLLIFHCDALKSTHNKIIRYNSFSGRSLKILTH